MAKSRIRRRTDRTDSDTTPIDPVIKEAKVRFQLGREATKKQRDRERADIKFYAGEQWDDDVKTARMGQDASNGLPPVPARPTLVINKTREPIRIVLNEERSSDIGADLVPADDFGDLGITPDDTEVTLREGLVRRIQRDSDAADARQWSFSRAAIAGQGYYRVLTRYLPGLTFDQEVYVARIYNQDDVTLDPAHELPTGKDANWAFIGAWVPWDVYKATYPHSEGTPNRISSASEGDFAEWAGTTPDWVNATEGAEAVYVVEYWRIDLVPYDVVLLQSGEAKRADELQEGDIEADRRTEIERTVKWVKMDGINSQPLETTDWQGQYIPILKVIGEELHPYDNQRRCEGMVRPSRDSQVGYNAMVSQQVQVVALDPVPSIMVDPVAIQEYEEWYKLANTRTIPFLPYRTYDDGGRQLAPPQRTPTGANTLAIAQSIQMFDEGIKSTTGVGDPQLGHVDPSLKSARAIKLLQDQSSQGTGNYVANLAATIRYEAEIINDLLYPIYGQTPGRIVRIMTGEDEPETMQIGEAPMRQAGMGQSPMAMQAGPMGVPGGMPAPPSIQQKAAKVGKLTKDAKFNIAVRIKKSSTLRSEQMVNVLGQLIAADPMQMGVVGDLFYKAMDVPGNTEMADRQKAMLAPPVQALLASKEQGQQPIPPQVQAQLAQSKERIQHAEAAIKELDDERKGKIIENQAKVQIEQMKAGADLERIRLESERDIAIQRMRDATAIRVAEINAETKGIISGHDARHEAMALHEELAFDAATNEAQRDHERDMAARASAMQATMGASDQEHEQGMAQMGQSHALEQAEQAAMLAPQPDEDDGA